MAGPPDTRILALDFGGTKQAAGVWAWPKGKPEIVRRQPTPVSEDAEGVLRAMLHLAASVLGSEPPDAVGISFNGPIDPSQGCPHACHHLPGWNGFPLRERIQKQWGVPAVIENDASAAAYGEWRYGAGIGMADLLYITVSTGVGGGLVLAGKLLRGHDGLAGEVGHICAEPDGPLCPCGRRGCLEAVAAGPAIVRYWTELSRANGSSPAASSASPTAEDVGEAAAAGDPAAMAALEHSARAVGRTIGGILNLLNLERIVVGGGVGASSRRYLSLVREEAEARVLPGVRVDVVGAALGGEAPLWGAAALASEAPTEAS